MTKTSKRTALGARHEVTVLAVAEAEMIALSRIRIDGGTQARAGLREETVEEYREVMEEAGGWGSFPKVEVVYDGESYWLTDGYHRVEAAQRAFGDIEVPVEILPGDIEFAILRAVKANATHGLRRSNADKRRAVTMLLSRATWQGLGDPVIAEMAGVTPRFVGAVRDELEKAGTVPVVEVRTGRDGRKINVAKIGRPPAAPATAQADSPLFVRTHLEKHIPDTWSVETREGERKELIEANRGWQPDRDARPEPPAPRSGNPVELASLSLSRQVAIKLHDAVVKNTLKMFLTPAENEELTAALKKALIQGM